jgi:TldD protein
VVFWGVLVPPRPLWVAILLPVVAVAQSAPLLDILKQELDRNFSVLKEKGEPPAYYLAYSVVDDETEYVSASFGSLQSGSSNRSRNLDVTLRLGSAQFDNYHRMRGDFPQFTAGAAVPFDDNANAVRRRAWLETDRVYRLASQRMIRLRTNTQVKAAEEDSSADFSPADPATFIEPVPKITFNRADWSNRLRRWSSEFQKHRGVLASNISLIVSRETKYLVNSEGTKLRHGRTFARIVISASGKAYDGMDLGATDSFEAESVERFPKDEVIQSAVAKVATRLTELLKAPPVEPFVGPAILSGSSAGVFFHEIFGHRIEGHRQKDEAEGQTFTKSIGQPVLPTFLSVVFDPTRKNIGGVDLNGTYAYDDEGVKAQVVRLVDKGVLQTFLLSRSPIKGFNRSNGHGRRQAGAEVVSRQSNLLVESTQAVDNAKLRAMLIEEVKKQGSPASERS